ncbi:MAG: CPBP family intramembrane metalloprotease [Planctomycetes bacterium]|nr:CPBP family intramembrane metalloprotease [Planctomycetota bacterium]
MPTDTSNAPDPSASLKGYWEETQRPIYSAALVLPFLLTYELGILVLHPNVINGGDALIITLMNSLSIHTSFASSFVLLVCFVVWQVRSKTSWKLDGGKLQLLFLESFVLAVILFFFINWISMNVPASSIVGAPAAFRGRLLDLVLFCGAGVYEELVFRVLLLGLLIMVLTKLFHMEKAWAAGIAVVIGATVFSLFHYIGPGGDTWNINSFLQRAFAGVFFSALYVTRSFGVAAATHAMYDILVGFSLMPK